MSADATGKVQTVLGLVDPATLGPTLTHEHLLIDLECYFVEPNEASERAYVEAPLGMDNIGRLVARWTHNHAQFHLYDEPEAVRGAAAFMRAGGGTIVDVTSNGIGRDPLALARNSRATGVNVVMGAGYYVPASHPADMDHRSEDDLYAEMVADVTLGVGDTGIKSGVLSPSIQVPARQRRPKS